MRSLIDRKSHVTVVPLPTMESNAHLAPCSSTKEPPATGEAGATVPRPVGMTLEPVEYLVLDVGGMPGPESVTLK